MLGKVWHIGVVVLALGVVRTGFAAPYSILYTGDDFPEDVGWERRFIGPNTNGANRTIQDGVLRLDTMAGDDISDCYEMERDIDAQQGERFIAEWRMSVLEAAGDPTAGVVFGRAEFGFLAFMYDSDRISSLLENWTIDLTPGMHTYRLTSDDMIGYDLYIDGQFRVSGNWDLRIPGFGRGFINFGDCSYGSSQRIDAAWDYLLVTVTPEPFGCLIIPLLVPFRFFWRAAGARFLSRTRICGNPFPRISEFKNV